MRGKEGKRKGKRKEIQVDKYIENRYEIETGIRKAFHLGVMKIWRRGEKYARRKCFSCIKKVI